MSAPIDIEALRRRTRLGSGDTLVTQTWLVAALGEIEAGRRAQAELAIIKRGATIQDAILSTLKGTGA